MTMSMLRTGDFLRVADLAPRELHELLELAAAMKADPTGWRDALPGESVACCFGEPSTCTRVSFDAAIHRLGALPIVLRSDELQLGRGDALADTARVLASSCAAIVMRSFAQRELEQIAGAADVPVINALSDDHHPCQALADLLTLRERFGRLDGLRLAYVGDGNNVANSLLEAGALAGMEVVVAAPAGYWPATSVLTHTGGEVTDDPHQAVRGAHAVYTDVWLSMGNEKHAEDRRHDLDAYAITTDLMNLADDDAVFLHCLPAHRGEEVAADVIDGPRSAVWQQTENRRPTEQAVLYALTRSERTRT